MRIQRCWRYAVGIWIDGKPWVSEDVGGKQCVSGGT